MVEFDVEHALAHRFAVARALLDACARAEDVPEVHGAVVAARHIHVLNIGTSTAAGGSRSVKQGLGGGMRPCGRPGDGKDGEAGCGSRWGGEDMQVAAK